MGDIFDKEKVYDEEIAPLMSKIIEVCKKHKIPMITAFNYDNKDGESDRGFCATYLPFEGRTPPNFRKMRDCLNETEALIARIMKVSKRAP